jgi:quinol monooxygenase YgiN
MTHIYSYELEPASQKEDAFRDAIAELEAALAPLPGFLGSMLLRDQEAPQRYRFDEQWSSIEDHIAQSPGLDRAILTRLAATLSVPAKRRQLTREGADPRREARAGKVSRHTKRVITETNPAGKSQILIAEPLREEGFVWETHPDAPLGREPQPGAHDLDIGPGRLVARLVTLPPDAVLEAHLRRGIPGHDARGFHRTSSVDFMILLEGQLKLLLEEGEIDLEPGDIVVQRATNHAWRAGAQPARFMCVMQMLDTAP